MLLYGMIVMLLLRRLGGILVCRWRRGYGCVVACCMVSKLRVDLHVGDLGWFASSGNDDEA
jgi:hypothetical protein